MPSVSEFLKLYIVHALTNLNFLLFTPATSRDILGISALTLLFNVLLSSVSSGQ